MRKTAIVCIVLSLILASCVSNMPPSEAGSAGNPRTVLVAGEDTAFKRGVLSKVIETLGTTDWYFKIVGIDQLPAQDSGQFGAILLLAHLWGGKIDKRVTGYLKQDPGNAKAVLLFTRGMESPLPESLTLDVQVDAVSSASRGDLVDAKAEQLAALLENKF